MILEDLNNRNFSEQLQNDKSWIQEVIDQPGQMYSHTAKKKAIQLQMFLAEKAGAFMTIAEYEALRNDLLKSITHHDGTTEQTNLFN